MLKETSAQTMLIGVLVLLLILLTPLNQLEVRDEHGTQIFCGSGDIRYLSRNSIYDVTVSEVWAIDSGVITIVSVTSTPSVLDYYGIESYRVYDDGTATGTPKDLHYNEVRMKATPRGEQILVIGDWRWEISKKFEEGQVLIIKPRRMWGVWGC